MRMDTEDKMLKAVAAYLKTVGWEPIVIGGVRIEKPIDSSAYHYEFVLKFTGGQIKPKKRKTKP